MHEVPALNAGPPRMWMRHRDSRSVESALTTTAFSILHLRF